MVSSTVSNVFVDTSGLYAYMVTSDTHHAAASSAVSLTVSKGYRLVTTDYVLDETATLLKARGFAHAVGDLFDNLPSSTLCRMEWMDPDRFGATRRFFLKHADHPWSFTDCFSFVVMRSLKLRQALTSDHHFREAGFEPLLG